MSMHVDFFAIWSDSRRCCGTALTGSCWTPDVVERHPNSADSRALQGLVVIGVIIGGIGYLAGRTPTAQNVLGITQT